MRTLMRVMVLVLLTASAAQAQQGTLTTKWRSKYMGAQGGEFHSKQVVQPDFAVTLSNGVYGDLWVSTGFDREKNFGKEVDLVAGRGSKIGPVNTDLNFQYYWIQRIDVANGNAEASLPSKVSPFVRVEVYFPRKSGGPRAGTMVVSGIRTGLSLAPKLSLAIEGLAKRDSGCFGFDSGVLAQGQIGLKLAVGSKTNVLGGVRLSKPVTDVSDGRKGEAVWELGLSRSF